MMAKPIRATPTLTGESAIAFIETMRKSEQKPISQVDKQLIQLMHENRKLFRV